jgi:tRNA(Ile2)-agmatinylcytidine synthase
LQSIHLGLDDTDSPDGMCTTYLATLLIEKLSKRKDIVMTDYPNLIRLNPNIPWKTRGNGAVAIRLRCSKPEQVFALALKLLQKYSTSEQSNPGLVLVAGDRIPREIRNFADDATWTLLTKAKALGLLKKYGGWYAKLRNGQGIVGALAAIGYDLNEGDFTFEIIGYRKRNRWGTRRAVDVRSVETMNSETYPMTFNNYDEEKKRVIITPRGPDPVLFGIRGEDPEILLKAMRSVRFREPIDKYIIFRSNQGTNAHLRYELSRGKFRPFTSGYCSGTVSSVPRVHAGAHVSLSVHTDDGHDITCFAYEPTSRLNKVCRKLEPGDRIEVGGGIRKANRSFPNVLNIEYLKLKKLATTSVQIRPRCFSCNVNLTSMGTGQGLRCPKCRRRFSRDIIRSISKPRTISPGLYLPSIRAHRHLTKPLQRYSLWSNSHGSIRFPIRHWNSFLVN